MERYLYQHGDDAGLTWGEELPEQHGGEFVVPGRRVLLRDGEVLFYWVYAPEGCPAMWSRWTWLADNRVLCCPGCGLDGT